MIEHLHYRKLQAEEEARAEAEEAARGKVYKSSCIRLGIFTGFCHYMNLSSELAITLVIVT